MAWNIFRQVGSSDYSYFLVIDQLKLETSRRARWHDATLPPLEMMKKAGKIRVLVLELISARRFLNIFGWGVP